MFAMLLEFLVFVLHASLPYTFLPVKRFSLPRLPETHIQKMFGLGLVVIGIIFTLWAMIGLGGTKTLGKKQDSLNQVGLYQFTRNPQVVAYGLVVTGLAILWVSVYSFSWVILYCFIAHMMVMTEEEHLHRIFNIEYERYCRETPRYVWGSWRNKRQ